MKRALVLAAAVALVAVAAVIVRIADRPPAKHATQTPNGTPSAISAPSSSESPSSTGSPATAIPSNAPPASLACTSASRAPRVPSTHSRFSGVLHVAHGDLWVIHGASLIARIDCNGVTKATIDMARLVPGFHATGDLASDPTGVWIAGWGDRVVTGARASGACAAVARTGPSRGGLSIVVRLSDKTTCPTDVIDVSQASRSSVQSPENYVDGIAFEGRELFVSLGEAIYRVRLGSGAVYRVHQGARHWNLFGAYGSLWSTAGGGPHGYHGSLFRTEPKSGEIVKQFDVNGPTCVTGGEALWCKGGQPYSESPPRAAVTWIEGATNRTGMLDLDAGDEENVTCGGMAWHADRFYCGWAISMRPSSSKNGQVRVVAAKTGQILGSIGEDPRNGVRSMAVVGDTLWIALTPQNALLWVDLTKAVPRP